MVAHVGPAPGGREDRRRRLPLYVGVLGPHHSPGPQQRGRTLLQRPDRVEAVGAGEQREVRVVVARLGGHRLPGLQRDVRRVADDHVDPPVELGKCRGQVALAQLDPGAGEVALGPGVRGGVDLDRVHRGVRSLVRDRPGDGAGAGAEVDDHGGSELAGPVDRPAGEELGLRARHEDPRADSELDVAEVGRAGEVLERLAGGAACDQFVVPLGRVSGHVVDHRQPRPLGAEHVGQQLGGVVLGARDAGETQPVGGPGERRPAVGHAQASIASSRAAMSASRHESSTGCRAPSSTWSRLCDL